jgi:hypothetical protein
LIQSEEWAGNAGAEKVQELNEKRKFEANKNTALNSDNTIGTRAEAAYDAVGNKWNEKAHEMKKEDHKEQSGITGVVDGIKNAFGAAREKVEETFQGDQYEANKTTAESSNNTVGTRVQAAKDAIGNKISEKTHEMKKNQYEERAGVNPETP